MRVQREGDKYAHIQTKSRNHSFINAYDFCSLLKLMTLYKCRDFSWSNHSAGVPSMEGSPSCYISDSVQCDSSDKQSMVCVWGKIFSVYFNRLFKIIYASGNWHMGDVFCYDSYGHRNNRRQGSDL